MKKKNSLKGRKAAGNAHGRAHNWKGILQSTPPRKCCNSLINSSLHSDLSNKTSSKNNEKQLHNVAPEGERLPYTAPDITVHKVQMESVFLVATSMMNGGSRIKATIEEFDSTVDAPDFNGSTEEGDITLIS